MKSVLLACVAVGMSYSCQAAVKGVPVVESFSKTKWIYAQPAEDPPANAYLRLALDIAKPVKSAYVYVLQEKSKGQWFDGKPFQLERWPSLEKFRGPLRGKGVDLKSRLSIGRHVLAFRLDRHPGKCYGMIFRGEIVFEDGERRELLSCTRQVKASGKEENGWLEPGFDDSSWKSAVELGDPRLLPWSKYGELMRIYASPEENARYEEFMRTGDLSPEQERQLLSEPDSPNVRVVYSGDTPGIEVNGKVYPPYTHAHMDMEGMVERERYFCHLRDLGMNIFGIKDFRRNRFEPEEGQYDFSPLDASIRRMLALNPDAYFILSYGNGKRLPKGWAERNPDELVGYAVLSKSMEECSYNTNAKVPSFASQVYRKSERKFWKAFGDYANSKPWGRRIIGIHCGFGGSGDGMPTGAHCMPDTGKRMTEAFRRYLQEKYATDADLQHAWGDDTVTRATAAVPDRKLRIGSGAYIRNLSDPRDRRLADYYDCYHKTFEEFILDFGATVKAALPGRIVGAYHGYSVLAYTPEGNTARIGRLLRSKNIDYFFATTRGYNLTDGLHRNLPSLCRMYGKLTSIEGDVRTHVSLPTEASDRWRCKTPEETRATFAKIVANALVNGSGWHMVDFGVYTARRTPWFDIPEALEPFSTALREWRRAWAHPASSPNEVAVVLDLEQLWKQGPAQWNVAQVMSNNLQVYPLQALNFSGFPYDLLAPEGYLASKDRYKAVVFLNLYETTPVLRGKLRAKLAADGSTALWCYAPGLAEPAEGFSARAMRELTGMELDFAPGPRTYTMKDTSGGSDALYGVIPGFKFVPRVSAKDAACEVSATWKDDGTAAIAKKRLADGTVSVFVGLPPYKSVKWAELLADAGCKAVTKPGFMVRRGNGYLEVFSGKGTSIPPESIVQKGQIDQSGCVEVYPVKNAATLTDVFTGETYKVHDGHATLSADSPRTWLFRETDAVGDVTADRVYASSNEAKK